MMRFFKKVKNIAVLAHLNCRNKGDEAVLCGILEGLNLLEREFTVFIFSEEIDYDKKFIGSLSCSNIKVFLKPLYSLDVRQQAKAKANKIFKKFGVKKQFFIWKNEKDIADYSDLFKKMDAIIVSAKDLYSECYGQGSFLKYIKILDVATSNNNNVYLWGGSYGPFKEDNEKTFVDSIKKTKLVSCRENQSFEYVQSIYPEGSVVLKPDPAFLLKPKELGEFQLPSKTKKRMGVSISQGIVKYECLNYEEYFKNVVEALCTMAEEFNLEIVLIPHVTTLHEGNNDYQISKDVKEECEKHNVNLILSPRDLSAGNYKEIIRSCDYFVGARTHTTIAALSSGVLSISIGYGRKAKGIFQDMYGHLDYMIPVKDFSSKTLKKSLSSMIENEALLKEKLSKMADEYMKKCSEAYELILKE